MPKATWSNSDLTTDDINEAEAREGSYAGPLPPKGVYRFNLRYMKQEVSKNDNDMLLIFGTLDGSWRPDHKKYNGCPLFDRIVLTKDWASKLKAACGAFDVTAADFLNKTVVDDDKVVLKIGTKKISQGMTYFVSVKTERSEGYDDKLGPNGDGYMAAPSGDDDAEQDESPAEAKKGSKKKGGKKAAQKDDEDPF